MSKKYNKIALSATAVLASLTIGMSIVNEVHAGESETTNSQEGVTYVGNIDVSFNGKQINSDVVNVDGEEPVFLDIHVMVFGDTRIPENAVVNIEMNGATVSVPIDAQGNAYSGLPLSIEKNTTYVVNISTSGFSGDAPQTITFVAGDKNYTDDIVIPSESTSTTTDEKDQNEVTEPSTTSSEENLPSDEQKDQNEVTEPSTTSSQENAPIVEEETTYIVVDAEPTKETEKVEESTTQSSVESITETSETTPESQPETQQSEEIKELPKTGTKQSKYLKMLGFFLLGVALGNLLFNFRKGGK